MDIYKLIKDAGIPTDNHESDLYVMLTDKAREILKANNVRYSMFTSQVDKKVWAEVPFMFSPWWYKRVK